MNSTNRKKIASRKALLGTTTELWLLGQPPLQLYLDHMNEMVIGGDAISPSVLVKKWRKANDYYGYLEKTEGDLVNKVDTFPLRQSVKALAVKLRRSSLFKRSFDTLPTRIEMVELDHLIVGHPYLNQEHLNQLGLTIGRAASPQKQFQFCQPLEQNPATVEMRQISSRRFTFWSHSTDFRFQEAAVLKPQQIANHMTMGAVGNALALFVGFSPNFLSLIQYGNRYLLHNGHHRAIALRQMGYTHAPCIIEKVTRMDELKLIAQPVILNDPAFYFEARRPPLLKDFLNKQICVELPVWRPINTIEISFEVKELNQIKDFTISDFRSGNHGKSKKRK